MACKNKKKKSAKYHGKHLCKIGGYCVGEKKCSWYALFLKGELKQEKRARFL